MAAMIGSLLMTPVIARACFGLISLISHSVSRKFPILTVFAYFDTKV
jgi:hypothetical protein